MAPYIIGTFILVYATFVIIKRVKAIKSGHYCSCGCENCTMNCKAAGNKKRKYKSFV